LYGFVYDETKTKVERIAPEKILKSRRKARKC
jgi:hypothetical protein